MIQRSDIDRYFREGVVTVNVSITEDEDLLFAWFITHKNEYPRMAAAARDNPAIPAAKFAIERLFRRSRDLLGVRRHSLKGETMRKVMLLRDIYSLESTKWKLLERLARSPQQAAALI